MNDNEQTPTELPTRVAFPFPFAAVEAAMYDWLGHVSLQVKALKFRRMPLTTGSSRFIVSVVSPNPTDKPVDIGHYDVMMINHDLTLITIVSPFPDAHDEYQRNFRQAMSPPIVELRTLMEGFEAAAQELVNLKYSLTLSENPEETLATLVQRLSFEQKKPGARAKSYNEWVRQQVQRGRNQREVFQEYLKKRGIDPADEAEVASAKEAFRKVLSRTKRT